MPCVTVRRSRHARDEDRARAPSRAGHRRGVSPHAPRARQPPHPRVRRAVLYPSHGLRRAEKDARGWGKDSPARSRSRGVGPPRVHQHRPRRRHQGQKRGRDASARARDPGRRVGDGRQVLRLRQVVRSLRGVPLVVAPVAEHPARQDRGGQQVGVHLHRRLEGRHGRRGARGQGAHRGKPRAAVSHVRRPARPVPPPVPDSLRNRGIRRVAK